MKVLFVCRGNVGRSQMGEALLRMMIPGIDVTSVGTIVVNAPTGNKSGQALADTEGGRKVIEVLREVGADASKKTRAQLTPDMPDKYDRVIVMAEKENIPDYLLKNPKMIYWQVSDPMKTDIDGHRAVRDTIYKLIRDNLSLFK